MLMSRVELSLVRDDCGVTQLASQLLLPVVFASYLSQLALFPNYANCIVLYPKLSKVASSPGRADTDWPDMAIDLSRLLLLLLLAA